MLANGIFDLKHRDYNQKEFSWIYSDSASLAVHNGTHGKKNFRKTAVNRGFHKPRKSDRLFGFRNRSKPRCRNTAVKTQATAVRVAKI